MATIRCMYSCDVCGIHRQEVDVPERDEKQNVVEWVEQVAVVAIQGDHLARTGGCPSRKLRELMIPVPKGTTRVGENVRS